MSENFPPEVTAIKNKLGHWKRKTSGMIVIIILIILGFVIIPSTFFQVQPDEEAVITRFGAYNRTVGPGLHFKLPLGFEKEYLVPTQANQKLEFGFKTISPGIRSEYDRNTSSYKESIMLTGDLNVADVEWIVQYKIADPKDYLFNIRDVQSTIKDLSESTIRQVVGNREVTEVLTYGREEIQNEAQKLLQQALNDYQAGIRIETVKLQDVNPPEMVKPSFNEVNAANQESDQLINEAWKAYNKIIPEAKGKANKTISEARGYATKRINEAYGDVERFIQLEKEFKRSPEVTKKRMYLESMKEILPQTGPIYVIDPEIKSIVPLLNLNK